MQQLALIEPIQQTAEMPLKSELPPDSTKEAKEALGKIEHLDCCLVSRFNFVSSPALTRSLVSFQASKSEPLYRWYKYKEAFSASLVESLLEKYGITSGRLLDPFAGSGTALFAASQLGMHAAGIELLPIGQEIIATSNLLRMNLTKADIATLQHWASVRPWQHASKKQTFLELRITSGAYPPETKKSIEKYIGAWQGENKRVQAILRFALLCILESISYTRKDGQYLRWDYRSGRTQGKIPFDKGRILDFDTVLCAKINEILFDIHGMQQQKTLFPTRSLRRGEVVLHSGSCLDHLAHFSDNSFDVVFTSPPYCNRYDYTRTYALELALLGIDEQGLIQLRQRMLSCTVENRTKDVLGINPQWASAVAAVDSQELLQAILGYIEEQRTQGKLNNSGIPRMVRGYFYEMACVMAECLRVMIPGARLFMVNDNVRYAGVSISVDAILSDIARKLGFAIESILVLPGNKGNSSQQMGEHGREPLRKCVYVWQKP